MSRVVLHLVTLANFLCGNVGQGLKSAVGSKISLANADPVLALAGALLLVLAPGVSAEQAVSMASDRGPEEINKARGVGRPTFPGESKLFNPDDPISSCLPTGISGAMVLEIKMRETATGMARYEITILDTLKELKAKCRKGKLVDRAGKPISFFALRGCWGTPPANYRQILRKQEKELAALKKGNTVVEIPCNPDPMLPPSRRRPGGA